MGGMNHAILNGKKTDIRDMVREGMVWAFNGVAGMTETPLVRAKLGSVVSVRIRNDTGWPHAIHLHGHHFQEYRTDGSFGPLRDTLYFDRQQTREIRFVADNPGKWMLHCHMLEHAVSGMMTWIEVA